MAKANIDILLEDLDESDMGSLLKTYNEINVLKKIMEDKVEMIRDKIKIMLKERKWDSYIDDDSQISVSITTQQRDTVNKKALQILLTDEQYNQVVVKTSFEKMLIVTPKDRERLKKYGQFKK